MKHVQREEPKPSRFDSRLRTPKAVCGCFERLCQTSILTIWRPSHTEMLCNQATAADANRQLAKLFGVLGRGKQPDFILGESAGQRKGEPNMAAYQVIDTECDSNVRPVYSEFFLHAVGAPGRVQHDRRFDQGVAIARPLGNVCTV